MKTVWTSSIQASLNDTLLQSIGPPLLNDIFFTASSHLDTTLWSTIYLNRQSKFLIFFLPNFDCEIVKPSLFEWNRARKFRLNDGSHFLQPCHEDHRYIIRKNFTLFSLQILEIEIWSLTCSFSNPKKSSKFWISIGKMGASTTWRSNLFESIIQQSSWHGHKLWP